MALQSISRSLSSDSSRISVVFILRMQRQISEFSLTARSSQEKRTSQSGENIFEEVSSFLK